MRTGSAPISTTSASPTGQPAASAPAVTPTLAPLRRATSSTRPVNVITGCSARGSTSCSAAGASTDTPCAPEVCTTIWPARKLPAAARPRTRPGSTSSGTASSTRSAWAATSSGGSSGTSGSSAAARRTDSRDTPEVATTWCPAAAHAAPTTAPTRPADTIPIASRAGRVIAPPRRTRPPRPAPQAPIPRAPSSVRPALRRQVGRERLPRARQHRRWWRPARPAAVVAQRHGQRLRVPDGPPSRPDDLGHGLVVPLPGHRPDRPLRDAVAQEREVGDGRLVPDDGLLDRPPGALPHGRTPAPSARQARQELDLARRDPPRLREAGELFGDHGLLAAALPDHDRDHRGEQRDHHDEVDDQERAAVEQRRRA